MEIPFTSSPRSSLGVEWELELVDLETPGADRRRQRHPRRAAGGRARSIRRPSTSCSSPASRSSPASARRSTRRSQTSERRVAEVAEAAGRRGLGVMCSGHSPDDRLGDQQISPNPRYAKLVEDMQWLARRLQIFGVHVHVGVRSPDKVIPIVNALTGVHPALPRALGIVAVLGRHRHRAGIGAQQGVRGSADRGHPVPAVGLGRLRAASWRR